MINDAQANIVHGLHVLLIQVILSPSLALLTAFNQITMPVWVRFGVQQVQNKGGLGGSQGKDNTDAFSVAPVRKDFR